MRWNHASICLLSLCSVGVHAATLAASEGAAVELPDSVITGSSESATGPVLGYGSTRSASATRTDTALHETPQSVSVVSRDVIEDISATRLQQALDQAGGVGRANNFGGQGLTTFTVRGFTTGEFYRNGFPINLGYPNSPDANTLERVEVLRGPAATLYGRGDPGGTFNVITKQPLAEQRTIVGSQFTDQGLRRGTLDTSGPLDEEGRLAYRLNVMAEGGDSFRDDVESERYGIASVLSWQVSDDTRIVLEGDFMRNNHPLDRGLTHYPTQRGQPSHSTYYWEKGTDNKLHNDNAMVQLRFEHQLNDDWALSGGYQYLDGSLKGNAVEANGVAADGVTLNRNFNYRKLEWTDHDVQLHLTGNFDTFGFGHTLITGVEYENYDYQSIINRSTAAYPINIFNPVLGQPRPALGNITTHDREKLKTWAAFVQDQVALTERLKVLGGVRIERFEHDYDDLRPVNADWDMADNAVTPRVGVIYDLTDSVAVYANASKSFKPNSGASRLGGGFDPEEGKAYELGMKWAALGGLLSIDTAVFHVTKENVQTVDPVDPAFRIAAGEVRSRGFEVNVAGDLTPEWRVIGGYAYTDSEVTRDNSLPRGTRQANIPRNSFNLLSVYEFRDGALRGLGLGANFKYVDDRAGQTAAQTYTMERYAVTDLLSFYQVNEHLRLNLDVRNVFNKGYEEGAFNFYAYPGEPRTVQTGFAYTF